MVEVEVGPSSLGNEPLTTALLRDDAGNLTTARVLGGPNGRGGVTRVAGFVVPLPGMRVRLDLREDLRREATVASDRAWVASGPKWTPSNFPIPFELGLPGSRDLTVGDASGDLDVAARAWSTVACTGYRASYGGTTQVPPGLDGKNVVYFHTSWPPELTPKGLAQTILHTDASNDIVDADIHVNEQDYVFSLQGGQGLIDLRSILTHELGHALGLGHTPVLGATMFATYGGGIAWRSLEKDDRDGVCALYPGAGARGCDADPCPSGFVCVADACERPKSAGVVCAPCDPKQAQTCVGAGDDARCVDLGGGARACGRACSSDAACGSGFHCKPTTSSGDLQCVSDSLCANGPDPCTTSADCRIGVCKSGACVFVEAPVDAGALDAGPPAQKSPAAGCSCETSSSASSGSWALALFVIIGHRLVRRRRSCIPHS